MLLFPILQSSLIGGVVLSNHAMFGLFEACEVKDGEIFAKATCHDTVVGLVVVDLSVSGKYSCGDICSDILIEVNECKLLPRTFERLHECTEGT